MVLPERGQGVGLAPGAAERLDQQAPRPVPQRVHRDVRLQSGDRLRPPPRDDQRDGVVLDRRRVQLGQPGSLRPGPGLGRELLERRACPQRQRSFERPDPVVTRPELGQRGFEQGRVDGGGETIAALRRHDGSAPETLTESRHNRAQRARRNRKHVTQKIHPQCPRGVHGQPGQQPALARAGQIEYASGGGDDLDWSQHAHERDVPPIDAHPPHTPLTRGNATDTGSAPGSHGDAGVPRGLLVYVVQHRAAGRATAERSRGRIRAMIRYGRVHLICGAAWAALGQRR